MPPKRMLARVPDRWFSFHVSHGSQVTRMKNALCLALVAFAANALAETPAHIDVSKLPQQSKMIDAVVVPVPSEIFGVLDKLGKPNWTAVQREGTSSSKAIGDSAQIALLLGTVIAEGFIAVEAEDAAEVEEIGKCVLSLASAIGVRRAVVKRSNSISGYAKKKNWNAVRKELDGALSDVKAAMLELKSEQLSQLVSLGGWLRGTEALTAVVSKTYSKDGAELLHQPLLLDTFEKQIVGMTPKIKANPVVTKVQEGLLKIRPLVGINDGTDISEKTVNEIGAITADIVKAINTKVK